MDAFSEVLSGVKLKGAMFFSAEFSAPWGFASPPSRALVSTLEPGAPHLVKREFGLPPARYRREHGTATGRSTTTGR